MAYSNQMYPRSAAMPDRNVGGGLNRRNLLRSAMAQPAGMGGGIPQRHRPGTTMAPNRFGNMVGVDDEGFAFQPLPPVDATTAAMQANPGPAMKFLIGRTTGQLPSTATMEGMYGIGGSRPVEQGVMPQGGPSAGQPYRVFNMAMRTPGGSRIPAADLGLPLRQPMPSFPDPNGLPAIPSMQGLQPPMMPRGAQPLPPAPTMPLPPVPGGMGGMPPAMPQRSDYYPQAPDPAMPFKGSPLARQGSYFFPSTPIGQMTPMEARDQVPSDYGVGTANGYVSRPGTRLPISEVLSQEDRSMLNRDSNTGPYGTLGGSGDRLARMRALVNQEAAQAAPSAVAGSQGNWPRAGMSFDSKMAMIREQLADPTNPENIARQNRAEQRLSPEYQANRSAQMARNDARGSRMAVNRRDIALSRGVAAARMQGRPLTPIQAEFMARVRSGQSGATLAGGPQGQGLNATRPFEALQEVAKVDVTPEREQELLGILAGVGDGASPQAIQQIRETINPGELEHLIAKYQPGALAELRGTPKSQQQAKLVEIARRIQQGENYRTPEQRSEDIWDADVMGAFAPRR